MPRDIVICGLPRSGSTLLYNMIRGTVGPQWRTYPKEIRALSVALEPGPKITKAPQDSMRAAEIARHTGARFIVTIRDPRDILVSRHARAGDGYFIGWDGTDRNPKSRNARRRPGLVERIEALFSVPDPLWLRYEELVRDPDTVQNRVAWRMGLEFVGAWSEWHTRPIGHGLQHQLNGVRPVETSRVGAWRRPEHAERIRQQFAQCPALADWCARLGYE